MPSLDISGSGRTLLICVWVFSVLCTAILSLRLVAARLMKRKLYADDYLIAIAYANTIALGGCAIWAVYNGLGQYITELDQEQINVQYKLLFSSQVTWLLGTVCAKLSLLFLYNRIFSPSKQTRNWCYFLIGLIICYGIAFLALFLSDCHPIDQEWNPVPGGGCRSVANEEYSSVSINLVLDLAVIIVPMPSLWKLQMPIRKKVFVSIMFSFGLLSVLPGPSYLIKSTSANIGLPLSRTIGIMCWRLQATVESVNNPDFSVTLARIGILGLLELWLGIICACMPTMSPLLKTYVNPGIRKLDSLLASLMGHSGLSDWDNSHAERASKGNDILKVHTVNPKFGSGRGYELDKLGETTEPASGRIQPGYWR